MLKEPHPGRVKTRLGAGIGPTRAAWWFRHQTAQLVRNLSADPRWQTVLAVSPDREGLTSRVWPRGIARVAQGGGDLGARMGRLFRQLPPGPVVIIGGDIPGIGRAQVAAAFTALGRAEAALGPAPDGGYWLIGLRRTGAVPAGLFRDVRWSTAHARADTEVTLSGLRIAYLQELSDIDTVEDLRRWQQARARGRGQGLGQGRAEGRAGGRAGGRDGPGQSC